MHKHTSISFCSISCNTNSRAFCKYQSQNGSKHILKAATSTCTYRAEPCSFPVNQSSGVAFQVCWHTGHLESSASYIQPFPGRIQRCRVWWCDKWPHIITPSRVHPLSNHSSAMHAGTNNFSNTTHTESSHLESLDHLSSLSCEKIEN